MIPDAEKLVGNHLRGYSGINARVVGKTPDDTSSAWIRFTQLDATNDPDVTPDYLFTHMLQCECYAGDDGGQPEAGTIGRVTRQAIDDLRGSTLGGTAVVTHTRLLGPARIPDTVFEPARERTIVTAFVTMHPKR